MTQRERQASAGVSEAGVRSTATPPPALSSSAPFPTPPAPIWEEYYQAASPEVQKELLALASQQGLLYSHQLPSSSNGQSREPHRLLLAHLLAGKTEDLEPVRPGPIEIEDTALDPVQCDAVARALHTPDFCLIQGLPGTGKTRVLAEIIRRAVARGERVLLLAATPQTLDHALNQLRQCELIYAARCLGREEKRETLAPALQELLFTNRLRQFREHTLESARQAIRRTEEQHGRLARCEPLWQHLHELGERHEKLTQELAALEVRRAHLSSAVEQEAEQMVPARTNGRGHEDAAFQAAVGEAHRRLQDEQARIEKAKTVAEGQASQQKQELDSLLGELERLRPLANAKQNGRWWTSAWWKATFQGNVLPRLAELESKQKQLQDSLARLQEELQTLTLQREQAEQSFQAERTRHVEAEIARRRTDLNDREAALRQEAALLQEKWQATCRELEADLTPPTALTCAAQNEARELWQQRLQKVREQQVFARQWAAYLEEHAATLTERVRDYVNVVAATTLGLHTDEHFGDAAASTINFDLMVLEEADQVTESEFLNVARRARRWVLLGEPSPSDWGRRNAEGGIKPGERPAHENAKLGKPGSVPLCTLRPARSVFFHHLWKQLHCDPRRLPYEWVHEKGGLCCRLRSLLPEQRQFLESERVADSTDIELRILTVPRTPPVLAEIVFPPRMTIFQAKEYIFRELAELPVRADRHSLRWQEQPDHLVLSLANNPGPNPVPVVLEHGVRELVASQPPGVNGGEAPRAGWHTCYLEFDRKAGWHRQRAEEWIQKYLGVRDSGRTLRLDVPYRMHPDLAAFLSDWLFDGAYDLPPGTPELAELLTNHGPAAVQFIPVPSLNQGQAPRRRGSPALERANDGRRGAAAVAPRLAKAGAGLELDAGDPRHRERLPHELRNGFTSHGYINFMEAQAIVRALEKLVTDPSLRAASRRPTGATRSTIGVLALYPAQAELIRRMVARVPALHSPEVSVKVDVPSAFREGECLVGLVSLTRSHSHRAVNFGEGPHSLVRALTRVRARLFLFGDPGTLARRSQWEKSLDPLDDQASAWEHQIISRLVNYLQGQDAHPHRFQLSEGIGL